MKKPVLLGFMGNRGFFPSDFVSQGAKETRTVVNHILGDRVDYVDLGGIETYADAKKAAQKAQEYKLNPDGEGAIGIILSMYNFSDENGIRDFCRLADLNIPILIHTEPDAKNKGKMGEPGRRDGACGRFSAANALRHIGYPYTLTTKHVESVTSEVFADDLRAFYATCQIATRFRRRGRGVRVGMVGNGPDAFQTITTASTELLGHMGMNTVGMELIELDRKMQKVSDSDLQTKIAEIKSYMDASRLPDNSLRTIGRMGIVFDRFVKEHDLDGLAVRCWTEMQKYKIGGETGVVPCTCMSMLSEKFFPSACESDLSGWMGMYLLQTSSGLIPALADWNNMFEGSAGDDNIVDLFHCGVWAKSVLRQGSHLADQQIIATDPEVRQENTWGTIEGDLIAGDCAYFRPCTNAREGKIFLYGGTGEVVSDTIKTFGTKGRVRINNLQKFFSHITQIERAVEHHIPVVVGKRKQIELAVKAVRDSVTYLNHQAGRNAAGTELIEYYEHNGWM